MSGNGAEAPGGAQVQEVRAIERHPCGRVQVRRVRKGGWTERKRQDFIDRLAATCCVGAALEATGMSASSLYRLRKRDPLFAEAWEEALNAHFDDVELALLRHAKESLAGHGAESDAALSEARARAAANPDFALELLKVRRAGDTRVANGGARRRPGGRVSVADKDTLAADIMKLVRAVRRSRGEQR